MKKKLAIVILVITIVALWVTPAFAAQGQITEVNPSGGTRTVVILQADEGEEEAKHPGKPGEVHRNEAAGTNGTGLTQCPTSGGC